MIKHINKIIILLVIIIIIFLLKILIEEFENKKNKELETKSIEYVLSKKNSKPNIKNNIFKENIIKYEIILEIPKIKLKKGVLEKNNKDNNIEKNVTILKESFYPNEEGNVFLAAHSGNGNKSFFNNLVNLNQNDIANLYYKEIKYTYKVYEIKEINKNNQLSLLTNTKNNLILITCSQKNKNKYLIICLKKIKETELCD